MKVWEPSEEHLTEPLKEPSKVKRCICRLQRVSGGAPGQHRDARVPGTDKHLFFEGRGLGLAGFRV